MKPLLDREIILNVVYLKQTVIDIQKALLLLQSVQALQSSPFPVNAMTVNFFRALVGAEAHPDERGNALLTDPDVVLEGDDVVTPEMLAAAKQALIANNEGAYKRGELQARYPELWAALPD